MNGILSLCIYASSLVSLLYGVAAWNPSNVLSTMQDLLHDEAKIYACGSLHAGLLNLRDTVQSETDKAIKIKLEAGRSVIEHNVSTLTERWNLPHDLNCKSVRDQNGLYFESTPYQLDKVDNPSRLINWSYRLIMNDTRI